MALPTDLELARLCQQAYIAKAAAAVDGVNYELERLARERILVAIFIGTKYFLDVARDLFAVPIRPPLVRGFVDAGMWLGLAAACDQIRYMLPAGWLLWLVGHSLGGAHAIASGLVFPPRLAPLIVPFDPPRCLFPGLARRVVRGRVLRGYRVHGSPVSRVPIFPYWHPSGLRWIGDPRARPPLADPFAYHHMTTIIPLLERAMAWAPDRRPT